MIMITRWCHVWLANTIIRLVQLYQDKNFANTSPWHMVNGSFCTNATCKQFQSLVWNLEDPILAETFSSRRKIIYCPFFTDFSQKLLSMQDFGHNKLHLNAAQHLS